MKICNRCHKKKKDSDFAKGQRRCRECQSELSKAHYHRNREAYTKSGHAFRSKRLFKVNKYKSEKGCHFCGETEPVVLDFHHKDSKEKDATISFLLRRSTMEILWKEVKKCEVVCGNCHRKVHAGILEL